jgi:protein-S-isoprenylcysteine O-methyltransferase Ste14
MTRYSDRMRAVSLELKVPPLIVVAIFAFLMIVVARFWPTSVLIAFEIRLLVALGIALAGFGVITAGVLTFRARRTTVNPMKPETASSLVATGIYRVTSNPMYLGMLLVLAGLGILLAHVAALPALAGFVLYMNRFQIQPEERALRERFGEEFMQYTRAVRRWI